MRHCAAVAMLGALLAAPALAATPPVLALAGIGYRDTSGEIRNQAAIHAKRLRSFDNALAHDLEASGAYRVVDLPCGETGCPLTQAPDLLRRARAAGAGLLLVGGVHKMSTLVQFARLEILDSGSGKIVFDRLYTFRGDTGEAWQKAEQFMAANLAHPAPPAAP